jgi:hypothetical protein
MIIDMILLYSLILAAILFGIYFYIATKDIDEEDENYEKKEFFSFNNFIIFGIIYIFVFTLLYLAFDDGTTLVSLTGGSMSNEEDYSKSNKISKSNIVDPSVLKHNNDPMKAGFEPYNSNSSSSGEETSSEDNSSASSNESDGSESD